LTHKIRLIYTSSSKKEVVINLINIKLSGFVVKLKSIINKHGRRSFMKKLVWLIVYLLFIHVTSAYAAVEYVKICSSFGANFMYLPGTDTCYDPATGETRENITGNIWYSHIPANPGNWVASPWADCLSGRLVNVGTFKASSFLPNSYEKYESAPIPLMLATNEFISKVMFRGGFNVTSRSNFCLSFLDATSGQYEVLGCKNTAQMMNESVTWSFTPLQSVPQSSFTKPYKVVGNSGDENWGADPPSGPLNFSGSLTCWVCIQRMSSY